MGSKVTPVSATGSLALPKTAAHREAAPHRCVKATSSVLRQQRERGRALTNKSVSFFLEKSKLFHQLQLEDFCF